MNDKVAHTLKVICQKMLAAGYIFHDSEVDAWPACSSLLCKEDAEIIVTPLPDSIGEVHIDVLSKFSSRHSGIIMVGTLPTGSQEIKHLFNTLNGKHVYINPVEKSYLRHVPWSLLTPAPRVLDESWCNDYANGVLTPAEAAIDAGAELRKHMAGHAETSAFMQKVNQATGFRKPTVTWVMIGIFAAIYAIMYGLYHTTTFSNDQLLKWGADQGQKIVDGEYWRLITAGFIHANLMHILFNCMGCYYFGCAVEQYQGRARLVGIFLFAVVTGNLAGLWMHPDSVAIGASGGLFGLIGMIAAMTVRYYRQMPEMVRTALRKWVVTILLYNVFFMVMPNVDISAHAGGLIGGFLMGLIVARPMGSKARPSLFTIALTLVLLIVTADIGVKVVAGVKTKLENTPDVQIPITMEDLLKMQKNSAGEPLLLPVPGKPGQFYIVGLKQKTPATSQPQK